MESGCSFFEAESIPELEEDGRGWPWIMHKGHRACMECRRKKTKCDMRQPICGLCHRTGGSCTFPTKRKTPEFRRPSTKGNKKQRIDPDRLERLVDLLESKFSDGQAFDKPSLQDPEQRLSNSPPNDADPNTSTSFDSASGVADQHSTGDLDCGRSTGRSPSNIIDIAECLDPRIASETRNEEACRLDVPSDVATELIQVYFDKVQPWLPLLHKPRTLARFMQNDASGAICQGSYSTADAFLLYGIFALAARHSTHQCFQNIQASDRGEQFATKATRCYTALRTVEYGPTLQYLQACILLCCYLHASGPGHPAWILTGVCVRFAYDLDLCDVDEREEPGTDPAQWTDLEERRRAFWLVWELDAFGSTISRRPSAINRNRMAVRLPVSDAAWFAETPIESPVLHPRPSEAWKILFDSPNQDERAWFLLANYLMVVCYDTCSSKHSCAHEQEELAGSVTCLSLAITQRFGLEIHPILFDSENFARSNWIIGMHLMLTSARTFISATDAMRKASVLINTREISRIILHWHPEYVALSHPFFACTLLPTWMNPPHEALLPPTGSSNPHQDMLNLILARYGSVWKLGSLLLDVASMLSRHPKISDQELLVAKYFAIYFPNPLMAKAPATACTNSQTLQSANLHGTTTTGGELPEQIFNLHGPATTLQKEDQLNEVDSTGQSGEGSFDLMDDWSSRLQLDYLCDDNQHFNYLQL